MDCTSPFSDNSISRSGKFNSNGCRLFFDFNKASKARNSVSKTGLYSGSVLGLILPS